MASEGKTSRPSSPLKQGLQAVGEGPETPRSHPGPRCQKASWERSQRGVSEEPSRSANTNAGQKPASSCAPGGGQPTCICHLGA